jgi:hypothetical protein
VELTFQNYCEPRRNFSRSFLEQTSVVNPTSPARSKMLVQRSRAGFDNFAGVSTSSSPTAKFLSDASLLSGENDRLSR